VISVMSRVRKREAAERDGAPVSSGLMNAQPSPSCGDLLARYAMPAGFPPA
jgi:hypothetical protein